LPSLALVAVALYEQHAVYHPKGPGYGWVSEEWETELLTFPNAAHDDQVDTAAYAAILAPSAMIGATLGAVMVYRLPTTLIRSILSVLLAYVGIRMVLTGLQ
jgi:hypothetical protein